MSEWTTDSNEVTRLSLVSPASTRSFHPTFTYPIFGEEEKIYGYKGLLVDVRYTSGSLVQLVKISYEEKLGSQNTVDNPEKTLKEFLPDDIITEEDAFNARVAEDAVSFVPLGEKVHEWTRGEKSYEVYHATWKTPGFKEYHKRMQFFILLYIEAGSYISDDDDQWEFFTLYEKRLSPDSPPEYHFMGYSSLYNFYYFPDKTRLRLSQFVILPPFQRGGHGSELYNAIYAYIVSKDAIAELTVEDPAEAFEDLRDKCDLTMLFSHREMMDEAFGGVESSNGGRVGRVGKALTGKNKAGKMGPPVDKPWAERWRLKLKLAGRQFQRLIEMVQLSRLGLDARSQRAYRLQVKERLYRFNFEILGQLEVAERQEKLEETFHSVTEDYRRILSLLK
ncbi:histone acetyltransferase type B [Cylindrobasidium torrendii FP15055 ss-10]|uniref:Histone acetyltransferase type B catalytic subunit n=1 Tax=Cylindrobasidium torrendii FP15055 ss-10 TaxID=1314674 RepID=A0A0D7BUJ0_9AGAR|nr:histone acetyltransferase type B [Cylindrobasidium torrendii FP15055 ss-10]